MGNLYGPLSSNPCDGQAVAPNADRGHSIATGIALVDNLPPTTDTNLQNV